MPAPIPPPKTSIFDVTLAGVEPAAKPSPGAAPGLLARVSGWFRRSRTEGPVEAPAPAGPLGRPKTSIFDVTLPGVEAPPPVEAPPSKPLGRPKTSIFDRTLPGVEEPLPAPPVEAPPSKPLGRPKTSIFDRTLPGVEPEPAAPKAEPLKPAAPKAKVEPLKPAAPQAKAEPLKPAEIQAQAEPLKPAVIQAQAEPPAPAVIQPEPPKASVEDDWDEGTAAEWNPAWAARLQGLPAAAPAVAPAPAPRRATLPRWAYPAAAAALVVAGMGFFLRSGAPEAAKVPEPPEALRPYYAQAETGDVAAMRMIGLRYCYGIAVPANSPEGVKWLRKAARAGNVTAGRELAAMGATLE